METNDRMVRGMVGTLVDPRKGCSKQELGGPHWRHARTRRRCLCLAHCVCDTRDRRQRCLIGPCYDGRWFCADHPVAQISQHDRGGGIRSYSQGNRRHGGFCHGLLARPSARPNRDGSQTSEEYTRDGRSRGRARDHLSRGRKQLAGHGISLALGIWLRPACRGTFAEWRCDRRRDGTRDVAASIREVVEAIPRIRLCNGLWLSFLLLAFGSRS